MGNFFSHNFFFHNFEITAPSNGLKISLDFQNPKAILELDFQVKED